MERYFIYDALGRKQGNPKGYKTYKGAQTQVDNKLYCLLEGTGLGVHLAYKAENPTYGGKAISLLEEKIDSVLADKPAKQEVPAVKQSL